MGEDPGLPPITSRALGGGTPSGIGRGRVPGAAVSFQRGCPRFVDDQVGIVGVARIQLGRGPLQTFPQLGGKPGRGLRQARLGAEIGQ